MTKRAVVNGKVMRTPSLGSYDNRRGYRPELHQPDQVQPDFRNWLGFEKDYPSTREADKALLVALGVNGEVPLAQARVNAAERRVFPYGAKHINGGWIAYLRPANDNHEFAAVAA